MSPVDILWILISTALVLFMQAGFLFLEAGLTRAKNSINVAVKNIVDLGFSLLLFWLIGYGLMFGVGGGWFGFSDFAMDIARASPDTAVFFIFQAVFAGTTVTIISGAIAERTSFRAYLGLVGLMAVVYPIIGHWVWGGGWLAERGFVDFAGSTVVHATGGWAALIAARAVGPRLGRFADDGTARPITPSNLPMAMFGGIVLAVGWVGFNGGSVLALDASVPAVVVHTLFGGAAGLIVALSLSMSGRGFVAPTAALNGLLGGLVAVTAGAHALPTWAAVVTGAIGGAVAYFGEEYLEHVGIDDAVGAVPVHLMAGAWGTLAVGLFGSREVLGTELSRLDQIGVQLLGIGATSLFTVGAVAAGLLVIGAFTSLRVSEEHEIDGLNASEHRTSTALLDLVEQLQRQARTGAIGTALEAEPFTEVGEIAQNYNELTEQLQRTVAVAQSIARGDLAVDVIPKSEQDAFGVAFRAMVSDLRRTVRTINASAAELSQNVASLRTVGAELERGMADQTEAVSSGLSSFEAVRLDVAELTTEVAELSQHTNRALDELSGRLTDSMSSADAARNGAAQTAATVREGGARLLESVGAIERAAGDIDRVVELVRNVAESTRMLALNAAIEAARAGDAGRSFSIVATEVEVLAMDTLASLGDIESAVVRVQAAASDAMAVSDGVVGEAVELSERTASEIEGVEAIVRAEAERSSRVREDFARLGDSMVTRAVSLDGEVQVAGGALSTIGSINEATHALVRDLREVENDVGHQATGLGEQLSHFRT